MICTKATTCFALLVLHSSLLMRTASIAQEIVTSGTGNMKVTLGLSLATDGDRLRVGPDPANRWELLPILSEHQVQNALQLSQSQIAAIAEVREELKLKSDVLQKGPDNNPEFRAEFQRAVEVYRERASKAVDELLTPEQLRRLTQIVFRMEIAILGYDGSLIHGRLGQVANVYENQYAHLASRTQKIMAEAEAKINEVRREAEELVLAELSSEQRKNVEEAVGPFFYYQHKSGLEEAYKELRATREAKPPKP